MGQQVLLPDGRRISREDARAMAKAVEVDKKKVAEVKKEETPSKSEVSETAKVGDDSLEDMTQLKKVELVAIAKELNLEVKGMSKDEIALAIVAKKSEVLL